MICVIISGLVVGWESGSVLVWFLGLLVTCAVLHVLLHSFLDAKGPSLPY